MYECLIFSALGFQNRFWFVASSQLLQVVSAKNDVIAHLMNSVRARFAFFLFFFQILLRSRRV